MLRIFADIDAALSDRREVGAAGATGGAAGTVGEATGGVVVAALVVALATMCETGYSNATVTRVRTVDGSIPR